MPMTDTDTAAVDERPASATASFAQERLWMIDRLVEDRSLYNTGVRFALDGPLDVVALRDALQAIVDRHEGLRSGFSPEDGRPQVHARLVVELREADLRDREDAAEEASRRQRDDLAAPFDLAQPPLFRWTLFRFDDTRHELLLTVHHIVFDGASVDVLLRELSALYPACLGGAPSPLPSLRSQCSEEAALERQRLDDDARARLAGFWRETLGDDLPVLSLPTDRPRPSRLRHRGATIVRTRDRVWREALEAACRRERTTPFMFVLACYAVWSCRYAGQDDVAIATPFTSRATATSRDLIGFFVNTLALRIRGDMGAPLRDWLRVAREASLAAFRHAELPFAEVVRAVGAEREATHAPVAQTMLVVQGKRGSVPLGDALRMRYLGEVPGERARFDLALVMDEHDDGVGFSLEYDRDLFDAGTAERMLEDFLALTGAAVADADCAADRLPMLSDQDRALLHAWARDRHAMPPDACAHRLFAALAAEAPDRPALRHGGQSLTRGALQARAVRLAAALRAEGVMPGDLVGICLPRGIDFVTTVLAVWTCGAAYLPMDPEHPEARHAWLVSDAQLRHVATLEDWRARFDTVACHALPLDTGALHAALQAVAAAGDGPDTPPVHDDPDALAYVIYTSGSTGEPKGVEVAHGALSRLLGGPEAMGYDRDSVMLQSVNPAFDASILETWGPLCNGGQLVIAPTSSPDIPTLRALIAETGVDTVTLPASLLDMWVELLDGPTGLSRIVVGGEALSIETVRRLYALDPRVVAINHYGPTENGILTTYHAIPREAVLSGELRRMPIGSAVPGTTLHVIDRHGCLLPPGVVGELVVGGRGLARGYLRRPALTAERFIALDDLDDGTVAMRGYRTGDLVRWQAPTDGEPTQLIFVGRVDQQVKIRGFRIEPGEIEDRLRRCAGVQDARVLVREHDGDRRLVAYVIANDGDPATWRDALRGALPGYMVPFAFVRVEAWPLTRNGKIDASALPMPRDAGNETRAMRTPRTPRECWLHDVWCKLLGVARIGIDDNFFALGGHSLLATRLQHRIRTETGADLPLRILFDARDLADMAAAIDAAACEPPLAVAIPRLAADAEPALSFAQQRLWFVQRLEPESAQYHIPYRLRLQGSLDEPALRAALRDLVARHAVLRTLVVDADVPRQRVLPTADVPLDTIDLRALPEAEREDAALRRMHAEASRPFDLRHDIPLRGMLLRIADDRHLLALTIHHIAMDGASMRIFEREWTSLYAAHANGTPADLPALPLQYADYAAWQRGTLEDAVLEGKLDALQARLRDAPAVHDLPLDRPRPPIRGQRGAVHRQRIPAAQMARLQSLARAHDATLFMLLHGAFSVLVARFSGNTDVMVGTPVAISPDDALAPLIGLFLNTVVLRSDLSGDPAFTDLLARSRTIVLDAFDAQDVPLDLLVERLKPTRSTAYTPLFQLMFALQERPVSTPSLPGLLATPLEIDDRDAKFDLALNLLQDEQGLLAEWDYDADLFEAESIAEMASAYTVLLDGILAAPETPVSALPLLDEVGRARMLALGNETDRPYPVDALLHHAFEAHAAHTPDAIALRFEGQSYTYADIDAAANRLARHLRGLDIGPDVPVAVAMPRHPALVIALLAILKAGGTFVAMDPHYPALRLRHLLADSGARVVLAHAPGEGLREALAALDPAPPVVDPIQDAQRWATQPAGGLGAAETGLQARHGAYLIYTSGSTGQPKGVINEHRGIVNRMLWMQERYPLRAGDRFLQTAAVGFGAAVLEIFWPLLAGATVLLARPEGYKDPGYLIDLIVDEGAHAAHFVPSLLRALLEHPRAAEAGRLADLFCGGEPLTADLARRCRAMLPATRLHHLYGSSETAVLSTQWDVAEDPLPERIPIGTAGANTRVYLLDAHGQPVPRGVRGEIHVAGRQVARGYLGRPELTTGHFMDDIARPGSGERMYRSGDLGRHRVDGSIEYLGRDDFQVKIRGQRVELGEIEAQLAAVDGVAQAVVVARDLGDGDQWLVGHLVPRTATADADMLIEAARRRVDAHLPDYMRPAAYSVLPALPLNANGKLDRAALPLPTARSGADVRPQAPETTLQRSLLALWHELLPNAEIGIDTDFFSVGGHSLLALRLSNRLREDHGYELELKPFFAEPTVRALADAIERRRGAQRALERFRSADVADIVEF